MKHHTLSTWIAALLGGLVLGYGSMMALALFLPGTPAEQVLFPLLLTPLAWAGWSLWIFHSPTSAVALKKTVLATALVSVLTLGGYYGPF